MSESVIQQIYSRNSQIAEFLGKAGEVTFESDVRDMFRKNLVLSMASYFENEIKKIILDFVRENIPSELICNFVKSKAIERQYHTFFDWDKNNANSFLGLFGQEFKEKCKKRISSDGTLDDGIKAFLEIGRTRNNLVHLNFSNYELNKSDKEYLELYLSAEKVLEFLREQLK